MAIYYLNDNYLRTWKSQYPLLRELDIFNNQVHFGNETLSLGNFSVQELLYNQTFASSLDIIDSKTMFDILKAHVNATLIKENNISNSNNDLSVVQVGTSLENGEEKVKFKDENGRMHDIPFSKEQVMDAYTKVLNNKSDGEVVKISELLSVLGVKHDNVYTWLKFYEIIHTNHALNQEETDVLDFFHGHIKELLKVEDYLSPEVKSTLDTYKYLIMDLESNNNSLLNGEKNEITIFHQMHDDVVDEVSLNENNNFRLVLKNPQEDLEKEDLNKAGSTNPAVIIILIANIIIHITFLILLKVL